MDYTKPKQIPNMNQAEPLANRIRPQTLTDYIGQEHLVGPNKPLRIAIDQKHLFSFILWGPPGVGKTTIARIYAQGIGADFVELSAVSAGKDDIRQIVKKAEGYDKPIVLFLDEIHRFNKAQQDYLLPFVERGILTLVGATTENPSFEIISPLLSRCRVFVLKELNEINMQQIVNQALKKLQTDYPKSKVAMDQDSIGWLITVANGDARQAITLLDNTFRCYKSLTLENLQNTLQSTFLRFDKQGEEHYNTISALIKSMRASNADAALYYLARLVAAGEDPLFIARRMVIFASEDVASPTALVVANAVFQACQQIGYPECQENLAAGTVYLSQAPKDRRAYDAYMAALADVKQFGNLPIPLNLRNAPTKLMKELGYGKNYQAYTKESLLPDKLKNKKYYEK